VCSSLFFNLFQKKRASFCPFRPTMSPSLSRGTLQTSSLVLLLFSLGTCFPDVGGIMTKNSCSAWADSDSSPLFPIFPLGSFPFDPQTLGFFIVTKTFCVFLSFLCMFLWSPFPLLLLFFNGNLIPSFWAFGPLIPAHNESWNSFVDPFTESGRAASVSFWGLLHTVHALVINHSLDLLSFFSHPSRRNRKNTDLKKRKCFFFLLVRPAFASPSFPFRPY